MTPPRPGGGYDRLSADRPDDRLAVAGSAAFARSVRGGTLPLARNTLAAYALDRLRTPSVKAAMRSLMRQLAATIPPADLDRIAVPTTLIWGRHDVAVRLSVAEAASAGYGWPLHVIENARDDPAIEQPEAFLEALRTALDVTAADADRAVRR